MTTNINFVYLLDLFVCTAATYLYALFESIILCLVCTATPVITYFSMRV